MNKYVYKYRYLIIAAEAALLGLVWAVALNLNIPAMVIGCTVGFILLLFLLQFLLPFVFSPKAMAGCAMSLGGWWVILMIAGLVAWLIRATAC